MGRKKNEYKIQKVSFKYNGDQNTFDNFMEAMIHDYLDSSDITEKSQPNFVGKVEPDNINEEKLDFEMKM